MGKHFRLQSLETRPTVSIVIPCYRYGAYLEAAVESALDQPAVECEIIIVDDASPDDSGDIADSLSARHSGVRTIRNAVNLGHIGTYNVGIREATGDYLVLLSADDLLAPASLTRALALLERHPDVGFVYGYAQTFTGQPPQVEMTTKSWTTWRSDEWVRRVCTSARNPIFSPEVVMRRSVFEAVGGQYDARFPHTGDLKIWLDSAMEAGVGRVNGPCQAYYRIHDRNMHQERYSAAAQDLSERWSLFNDFFERHSAGHAFLRKQAPVTRRNLANEAVRRALHLQRSGVPAEEVNRYSELAVEIWPGVARTTMWRLLVGSDSSAIVRGLRGLTDLEWDLEWRLRWQRWRRYGT